MSEPKIAEGGLSAWGRGMEELGVPDTKMIDALKAPKTTGSKLMESLNLPRYERQTLPLDEFLANPEQFISPEENKRWFALLELKAGGMKFRDTGLKNSEIMNFVNKTIAEKNLQEQDYTITFSETLPQAYGGNIIVNKEGNLLAEISRGGQGVVAEGSHDEEKHGSLLTVRRDAFLDSFKYSWEDGEATDGIPLREAVYKTIMNIPHEGSGRDLRFKPGYYEFHLVHKDNTQDLEPKFVDARQDESLSTLPPVI